MTTLCDHRKKRSTVGVTKGRQTSIPRDDVVGGKVQREKRKADLAAEKERKKAKRERKRLLKLQNTASTRRRKKTGN